MQAENQVRVAEAMAKKGAIINLGFGDQVGNKELARAVSDLIEAKIKREKMSRQGQQLVDGQGCSRCAEVVSGQ